MNDASTGAAPFSSNPVPPGGREPITGVADLVEAMLRQPQRLIDQLQGTPRRALLRLGVVIVMFAGIYGLVVGSFSGAEQWCAAPVKIALGTLLAGAICLPSLYVFACLAGSTARLSTVVGVLGGLLVLSNVLLLGFAPVAWLFSQSTHSVAAMGGLHLAFWLVAVAFGAGFLCRAFQEFGLRSMVALRIWLVVFVLVTLQMTAALRPLVGRGETFLPLEKKSFLRVWGDELSLP